MVEERGWHIANGNITGDEEGEWTYVGVRGATVIDYVICNEKGLEEIVHFKVEDRIESDHQPLVATARLQARADIVGREEETETVRQVFCWGKESIEQYKSKIRNIQLAEGNGKPGWQELKAAVLQSMDKRVVRRKRRKPGHKFWWDKQCSREKRKVKVIYKKWKIGKVTRQEYLRNKAEFREMCKRKEVDKREEEIEKIRNVKTEGQVWTYINKERKRNTEGATSITMEEWLKHFVELLGGTERVNKGERRQLGVGVEEEDELTDCEIEGVMKKIKRKKAAGEDEIPGEAWVHMKGEAKRKVFEIIKEVWRGGGLPDEWRNGVIVPLLKKGG
ncbi:uncharacterized protein LOC128882349 [Hylaeus volcanicus]|uniref:uncharacterized protein LOC128882349 n=1 Tax=Hylaeus volcanicus TaxID=313075 RepID=UPI0023B87110|nr:uncharacterized protein LOC128882349 [Hylaeus volcanicus]